jgi:hypothetical protein
LQEESTGVEEAFSTDEDGGMSSSRIETVYGTVIYNMSPESGPNVREEFVAIAPNLDDYVPDELTAWMLHLVVDLGEQPSALVVVEYLAALQRLLT